MKRTHLLTGPEPLDKILSGVNKLADAVGSTLGPRGRNVIFKKLNSQTAVTHDGVTVARAIDLDDPAENVAVDLMKQAATKMESQTGDGTTTVTVLTRAILKHAAQRVMNGDNPMALKKQIDSIADQAVEKIKEHVIHEVGEKEVIQVASVAAGDSEIGYDVGHNIYKAGPDTPVILNFSDSTETSIELIKGTRIPSGSLSPYLLDAGEVRHESDFPFIVIADSVLRDKEDVMPILRAVNGFAPEDKKFLLIAKDVAGDALSLLTINKLKGFADIMVTRVPQGINAPSQYLADLAVATGARVLGRNTTYSIDDATVESFGRADKVTIDFQETVIVAGHAIPEDMANHLVALEKEKEEGKTASARKFASDRLTTLQERVLSIYVGGQSQAAAEERHYRYEDAIGAARSALRKGVVAGGGTLLFMVGGELAYSPFSEPFFQLMQNAGIKAEDFLLELDYGLGIDVTADKPQVIDMVEKGILDPAESEIEAVKTAASIAGLLLTSGALIVEEQVHDENPANILSGTN